MTMEMKFQHHISHCQASYDFIAHFSICFNLLITSIFWGSSSFIFLSYLLFLTDFLKSCYIFNMIE